MKNLNIFERVALAKELVKNNGVLKRKPKAAVYARVGSLAQLKPKVAIYVRGNDADSVANQKRICNEYAERKQMDIAHVFYDTDISGTGTKHPGLDKLMLKAKNGAFERVIVSRFDRVSRKYEYAVAIQHRLKEYGIELMSALENESVTSELHDIVLDLYGGIYRDIYLKKEGRR